MNYSLKLIIFHLLIILLLSSSSLVRSSYCGPFDAIDWHDIESAQPSDVIDIYYLASPILYCDFYNKLSLLNGYHSGIGVVNQASGKTYTFNFVGFPSFGKVFLPTITKQVNGTYSLDWQNGGKTFIYEGINTTYWHTLHQMVATVNGSQFNDLMLWAGKANVTFPHYNPWFVYSSFPDEVLLEGFECFQFSLSFLKQAKALGGHMLPGTEKLPASIGSIYSNTKPIKVDINDPKWNTKIVEWYLLLERKWSDLGIFGVFKELWSIFGRREIFIRVGDDYYLVKPRFPYFYLHWAPVPY